jgi:curved DNA-binding protein CbpA
MKRVSLPGPTPRLAPGSGEDAIRTAYRRRLLVKHPDAGGTPKELAAVHAAYDALSADAWRHDEGEACQILIATT